MAWAGSAWHLYALVLTGRPSDSLFHFVPISLGFLAAVALSVPNPGARGRQLLGGVSVAAFGVVGGLWVASGLLSAEGTIANASPVPPDLVGALSVAGLAAALGYVLRRLEPGVRRRLLVVAVSVAVLVVLSSLTHRAQLMSGGDGRSLVVPSPAVGQWLALLLTPMLTFALGAYLVRLGERRAADKAVESAPDDAGTPPQAG